MQRTQIKQSGVSALLNLGYLWVLVKVLVGRREEGRECGEAGEDEGRQDRRWELVGALHAVGHGLRLLN